jgi:hypothetical protein
MKTSKFSNAQKVFILKQPPVRKPRMQGLNSVHVLQLIASLGQMSPNI